jgi:hypothetical protein
MWAAAGWLSRSTASGSSRPPPDRETVQGLTVLIFIFGFIALGLALVAGAVQRRLGRVRAVCSGLLLSYAIVALSLAGGELYFRYAFAESDGLPTWANQNWLARYWHTNSLGYRDREWTPDALAGKQTVLVVGDSFTAGWGIAETDQRFTGVLAERLGEGWAVINLGRPGTTTPAQTEALRTYPLQHPDWVIWQYTLNDIDDAALSIGLDPGLNPFASAPAWAGESALGNFLFWRLAGREVRGTGTYSDWLFSMYDHSEVWRIHAAQLDAAIDQVEAMGAQLGVVIFPDMLRPFDSIPYVDRVASVFAARGYGDRVVRLFDAAERMPLTERIVNPRDAHPSAAFSRVAADLMWQAWFAPGAAAARVVGR